MRKLVIVSAIALSVGLLCSGVTHAEATPVEKVKVMKPSRGLDPVAFHNFDMDMPVYIKHDYQATYTYPAPTGIVVSSQEPLRVVEARCNSPSY